MAGNQDDQSKKLSGDDGKSNGTRKNEKRSGGQQCGTNITGHTYRCAVCLHECVPILPDNCTPIPVCESCWLKIGGNNKLLIVSFFQNTQAITRLTTMIQEALSHRGIVAGLTKPSADQN